MSSRPRAPQAERKPGTSRRSTKGSSKRLNRAQQRAMQVRAAETRPGAETRQAAREAGNGGALNSGAAVATAGRLRTTSRRAIARPIVMSHEEEYRYVREDLRRLVATAAILLVVMIAVLLVVD